MKSSNNIAPVCLLMVMVGLIFIPAAVLAQAAASTVGQVDTSNAGVVTKVAPGELLPISVKLSNFGGSQRVDVLMTSGIFSDTGKEIYSISETVAVETTNNFVKMIQVPLDTAPGAYVAKTSIIYGGQLVPATTQFPFTVERKIFGFFQSDFFFYGGVAFLVCIMAFALGWVLVKRRRKGRSSPYDYSAISRGKRTFYEILSDTIMQMRQRVGDDALAIASQIDGLRIDKETGRVLSVTKSPAKIIATLVSEYEKKLGKRVSFSFRKT